MTASSIKRCTHSKCYWPEQPCFLGDSENPPVCKYLGKVANAESKQPDPNNEVLPSEFPWGSNIFGLDDLEWLAACTESRMLVPIGSHNSGKTTLLGALYLGISRGKKLDRRVFSGSFTLGGWENIAAHLRYPPNGSGPNFPPHTVIQDMRCPGLLHLSFGIPDVEGSKEDVLIADGMGEWFSSWSISELDPKVEGARWAVAHGDAFLFLVDSGELAGPNRGSARDDLFKLAARLESRLAGRPIAIVRTKADTKIPEGIAKQVLARLTKHFPGAPIFEISVLECPDPSEPTQPFLELLTWFMKARRARPQIEAHSVSERADSFLAYRGKSR